MLSRRSCAPLTCNCSSHHRYANHHLSQIGRPVGHLPAFAVSPFAVERALDVKVLDRRGFLEAQPTITLPTEATPHMVTRAVVDLGNRHMTARTSLRVGQLFFLLTHVLEVPELGALTTELHTAARAPTRYHRAVNVTRHKHRVVAVDPGAETRLRVVE